MFARLKNLINLIKTRHVVLQKGVGCDKLKIYVGAFVVPPILRLFLVLIE